MNHTIPDFINYLEREPSNPKTFNFIDIEGQWQSLSTTEFLRQVRCISAALAKMGLKKGEKVAIISPVSHLWSICAVI